MSYQVLARKWRPARFQDFIGQEHVVRALTNALEQNRLHHAFLFTGTRGVGKTTLSRIFAKALNCERGVSADPCGQCPACQEIDSGRFVDLIEVDAASRTKVEDTRDLLENVQYAPTRGRYKVYLIDEVHMLSTHSFNALLKTLEEPPPHVKFLLATTDPQRLPVTVLSRCLQFNLKRLPTAAIGDYLHSLLTQEGIDSEPAALAQIARAGEGSMRDALSLLDQAIAYGGGRVTAADVSAMLGTLEQRHGLDILSALAAGDAAAVMAQVEVLDREAPDYGEVLAELINLLQKLALRQLLPETPDDTLTDPEIVERLTTTLSPEDIQLYYQIALIGRRDLPLVPEPRGGFEMILLRMLCFRPAGNGADRSPVSARPATVPSSATGSAAPSPQSRAATQPSSAIRPVAVPQPRPPAAPSVSDTSVEPPPAAEAAVTSSSAAPPTEPTSADSGDGARYWLNIVDQLPLSGMAKQLALHCVWLERDGNRISLGLDPAHHQLRIRNVEERLQAVLSRYFDQPISLQIRIGQGEVATPARHQAEQQIERQQAAVAAIDSDPNVQALRDTFNARVRPESVKPLD